MTDEARASMLDILTRYGFSTLVAIALAWFIRTDLLQPLLEEHRLTLEEHRLTLKEIRETQRDIAAAIKDQTQLLITIESRIQTRTADAREPVPGKN